MRRDRSIRGCEEQRIERGEERREEKRGRWRCRKARATGQRTIIQEMELARAMVEKGWKNFGRGRSTVRMKTNPRSHHTHRQRCLRTGIGTEVVYLLARCQCHALAHVPGRSTARAETAADWEFDRLAPPILKQPFAGRGMFLELRKRQRGRQLQPRSLAPFGWPPF
jgi:hypothetical protein